MSKYMEIFVNTDETLADLVKTMERLLNMTATQTFHDDHDIFVFSDDQMYLDILEARDFENDRDMQFEEYPYYISIRGRYIEKLHRNDPEGPIRWQRAFAQDLYERIKALGKHDLLLTRDLQEKLAEDKRPQS
jgi:hypothetical protein